MLEPTKFGNALKWLSMSLFTWFKCTKSADSVRDHWLSENKVLGLSLTSFKWLLDIGTMTIESVPHPWWPGKTLNSGSEKATRIWYQVQITFSHVIGIEPLVWVRVAPDPNQGLYYLIRDWFLVHVVQSSELTLSEEIAQYTVYHHFRQICVYLHFTIMHKVIGVTWPLK